ncbi:MAG: DM13 domain-containing protein [Rhodospirillales bacterium]|nr:DM13 domain-containing protein [Rhodospirillales bacterium]
MRKLLFQSATHIVALMIGFGLGIYFLPIITAPASPDTAMLEDMAAKALYKKELSSDLRGNDFLHWGKGTISVSPSQIIHQGSLAPGPDYKLYLLKDFVEHEDEFLPVKSEAQYIGEIKTFEGFVLSLPENVDIKDYTTVLIWCEAFSEFITAAKYR